MIITDYKLHSKSDLFDIIRATHIKGDDNIYPFAGSNLNIRPVSMTDLIPTQTFVLQDQLNNIDIIRNQMMRYDINVFKMDGFLSYKTNFSKIPFVFTPPIIEVIDNQPLIIDGMHRAVYAHEHDMKFNALIIENIDKSVYPYQLPLNGGWSAVKKFQDKLPDGFVRKERRYPGQENKYYFREYPFPGIIKLAREHTGR